MSTINSLTYFFNIKKNEMIRNGNYMFLRKFIGKIREMTSGELIFSGFKQFGTTVPQQPLLQPIRSHVMQKKKI